MINVSDEFKALMQENTYFQENAEITFADGRSLTLGQKDFTLSNNMITDGADTNGIPLGVAVSRTAQIELINDDDRYADYDFLQARIRLYLTFQLSETVEQVECGTFTVITPETYGTTVIITAQDDMYKADKAYSTGLSFPATAAAVLNEACDTCGISLSTASFKNSDFIIQTVPSSDYTFRQVIGWIAMLAAGNARINRSGSLEILTYSFDYTQEHHVLKNFKNSPKADTSDITITGIRIAQDDVTILQGTEGYVLSVENPLATGQEQTLISILGDVLIGVSFRKFEGDHIGYPIAEFMDLAEITDWKGNVYKTFLTDITFVFYGYTTMKNSAESGLRITSTYSSDTLKALISAKKLVEAEKTARELAVQNLNKTLEESGGLYATEVKLEDNSTITYWHDKPTLEESANVIKVTANAIGFSTDGGESYPYGITLDGQTITKILYAEGINADYINAGTLTVKDSSGTVIFQADMTTGKVVISGDCVMIGDTTVTLAIQDAKNQAALARNMAMQLNNEYQAIPVNANGEYTVFPDCSTTVTVMYGSADVSADCTYSVTKSDYVAGSWDKETRTYTVTALAADSGWVDITATYAGTLTITKRFTITKLYAGASGEDAATLRISSSRGTVFKNNEISTVLSVAIYMGGLRITDAETLKETFGSSAYLEWSWQKMDEETFGVILSSDSRLSNDGFMLTLSPDDVNTKVTFMCQLITD